MAEIFNMEMSSLRLSANVTGLTALSKNGMNLAKAAPDSSDHDEPCDQLQWTVNSIPGADQRQSATLSSPSQTGAEPDKTADEKEQVAQQRAEFLSHMRDATRQTDHHKDHDTYLFADDQRKSVVEQTKVRVKKNGAAVETKWDSDHFGILTGVSASWSKNKYGVGVKLRLP